MDEVAHTQSNDGMLKNAARMDDEGVVEVRAGESSVLAQGTDEEEPRARRRPWNRKRKSYSHAHFKVYKRRWFGLAQLVLLNVVVSWDVSILSLLPSSFAEPHVSGRAGTAAIDEQEQEDAIKDLHTQ
jgi:hypothetical protein